MKRIAVFFLVVATAVVTVPAQSAQAGQAKGGGDIGIIFQFQSLLMPFTPYADGFQTGAGLKYWLAKPFAIRALAYVDTLAPQVAEGETATSDTWAGLDAGFEWHPAKGKVSPYVGGLAGMEMHAVTANPVEIDLGIGAFGGVECVLSGNFSMFAEYDAMLTFKEEGMRFAFGKSAIMGLIVYF